MKAKIPGASEATFRELADKAKALWEGEVFQLPAQLCGEQLCDLVLETFARQIRERQVVGILANA